MSDKFLADWLKDPNGTRWSEKGHPGYAVRSLKIPGYIGTAEPDGTWEVLLYSKSVIGGGALSTRGGKKAVDDWEKAELKRRRGK